MICYIVEKSINGGGFIFIFVNGKVLFNNVGEWFIFFLVGLNVDYVEFFEDVVCFVYIGEKIFVGLVDDFFFVDFGGIFDFGDVFWQMGDLCDGLVCLNISVIVLEILIQFLFKKGVFCSLENILDFNYVIGVWVLASCLQICIFEFGSEFYDGDWV